MKLSELADLVTVRNHINAVINDQGLVPKTEFKPLYLTRVKLDKKFISAINELDIDKLFSDDNSIYPYKGFSVEYALINKPVECGAQLELPGLEPTDGVWEDPDASTVKADEPKTEEDIEAEDLALIAARVKAQKDQLKKEGRSNKRISKAKNDSSGEK
jgi:NACalpha-BTF3-like transcription factor